MDNEGAACPVCRVVNAVASRFCSACGAELPELDDPTTGVYPVVGVDVAGDGEIGQLIVTRGGSAGSISESTDEASANSMIANQPAP